jgi:transposase
MGADRHHPANQGGRGRTDHLGRQRGLNDRLGRTSTPPAPAYTPASSKNRPVASRSNAESNELKRHRAVATRYDKLAVRYEAILHIAVINDWLLTSL